MSATTAKVPFGQKIAFGVGMLANQMFPAALGIFMVVLDVGHSLFPPSRFRLHYRSHYGVYLG